MGVNKLLILCAPFTIVILILNFITIHVHSTLIIELLTNTEFWTVKSSSETAAFIFVALGWNTFTACCLQNLARSIFIPVGSMVGHSDFSPSFLFQPYSHGFSWGGLPITQFYHMFAIWCNSLMLIWRATSVVRRLLSAGGVAVFSHHQPS